MEQERITVQRRVAGGKRAARRARRQGSIPGVCYGRNVEPFGLTLAPDDLDRVLHSSRGRNTVVALELDGDSHTVMLQELQRDPVRRTPVHVDFRVVREGDVVVIEVPVRAIGRSRGEETGGRLVPARRTVAVRCKVKDIPESVEYDISDLALGDNVLASHLTAPPDCEIAFKSDYLVLQIAVPRGAEEEAEELEAAGVEEAPTPEAVGAGRSE